MPEGGQVPEDSMKRRRCACSRTPCALYERSEEEVNIVGRIKVVREGDLTTSSLTLRCWFRSCRWPGRHPAISRCRRVVSVWITKRKRRRSLRDRSSLSSRISAAARIAASRFNTSCSDGSPRSTCSDSWDACSQRTANTVMGRVVELCLAQVSAARCALQKRARGTERPNVRIYYAASAKTILKRVAIPLPRTVSGRSTTITLGG